VHAGKKGGAMRRPAFFSPNDQVPEQTAKEMAAVGIIPSEKVLPLGTRLDLFGTPFVVTGPATREEFFQAAKAAGLDVGSWVLLDLVPYFFRISGD
jgi:hypothetical protein